MRDRCSPNRWPGDLLATLQPNPLNQVSSIGTMILRHTQIWHPFCFWKANVTDQRFLVKWTQPSRLSPSLSPCLLSEDVSPPVGPPDSFQRLYFKSLVALFDDAVRLQVLGTTKGNKICVCTLCLCAYVKDVCARMYACLPLRVISLPQLKPECFQME